MTDRRDAAARQARRDLWNERHAGAEPIESYEPNPALVSTAALLDRIVRDPPGLVAAQAEASPRAGPAEPAPIDAVVRASRPTIQHPSTETD